MMGRATTTYFDQAGSHDNIGFVNAPEKPKQLMKMDVNLKELGSELQYKCQLFWELSIDPDSISGINRKSDDFPD